MVLKTCMLSALAFMMFQPLIAQGEFEGDPIEANTFPPELVMRYQQAIGLSEEQRDGIKKEVQTAQNSFTDLEWDLKNEMESFISLIEHDRVDEKKALGQLEKILALETRIKRTHLTLAIRIKNVLTKEQQDQLRGLREPPEFREPMPE